MKEWEIHREKKPKPTLASEAGGQHVSLEAFETEKLSMTALSIFRALGQEIHGRSVKNPPIQRLFPDCCRNPVKTLKMMQFDAFYSCFLLSP